MKNIFILLLILSAVFLTACKKCKKEYQDRRISSYNHSWIPDIAAPFKFQSNGKDWELPTGGTKLDYQKSDDCIEGCCENYYNWESKRLMVIDSNGYDNFQIAITPGSKKIKSDSLVDFFSISYLKYVWLDKKPSVSSTFIIPVRLDSLDYWAKTTNRFYSTLDINGKNFENVYCFDDVYITDSTYNMPNKVFYNKQYGIVGFATLNGEKWNRK